MSAPWPSEAESARTQRVLRTSSMTRRQLPGQGPGRITMVSALDSGRRPGIASHMPPRPSTTAGRFPSRRGPEGGRDASASVARGGPRPR
eukprot:11710322-Alexandrium_andersonii.AAC.1